MVMAVEAEVVGLVEIPPTLDLLLGQAVAMLVVATLHRTGKAMVDRVR